MTAGFKKALFVDVETAFDVFRLQGNDMFFNDQQGAKIVRAAKALRQDELKVVFIVRNRAEEEKDNVIQFDRKCQALNKYFLDDKEIISEVPSSESGRNIYKNILTRLDIAAENAVYLTSVQSWLPERLMAAR